MSLTRVRSEMSWRSFEALSEAAARKIAEPVFALHYTSTAWGLGRVRTGSMKWFGGDGSRQVFEARVFCGEVDLRWISRGESGSVTCWSESESLVSDLNLVGESQTWADVERLQRRYVLWGQVDQTNADGVVLSDARVGRYEVPIAGAGRLVRLDSTEYLVPAVDGNVVVIAECLRGFSFER